MELSPLVKQILAFRDKRDWAQFHTPKNLAAALAIEASELQEEMLWKTDTEVRELLSDSEALERIGDEIADVLIFALLLCGETGVDPGNAIRRKLEKNAAKYPVESAKGSAVKYTDL